MAPVEANIFFVENEEECLVEATELLENEGHHVVETASTLEEALARIPDLDKKGVNVALVDGSLRENRSGTSDGELVTQEIKKQHPEIKVIGYAGLEEICNADVNCLKIKGPEELIEVVTNI
jgi:DNA-binding NtrC family response regulator